MPQHHLLPCPHCDVPVSVDTTLAGQEISCPHCSQPVAVPTLRKIRELPLDEDQAATETTGWSFERRSRFAVGMATFLVGVGVCASFLYLRSQLDTEIPPVPQEDVFLSIVDNSPIDELWLKWKESVRPTELGEWTPSEIALARRQAKLLLGVAIVRRGDRPRRCRPRRLVI